MDGTSKSRRKDGRFLQPSDKQWAVSQYPSLVVAISLNQLQVEPIGADLATRLVRLFSNSFSIIIPYSDYQKIIQVVSKLGKLPLFPSDFKLSYDMAAAELSIVF